MTNEEELTWRSNAASSQCDFPTALAQVIRGKRVTRHDWDDPKTYLVRYGGFLMLHKSEDQTLYQLIVSDGDMLATDWMEASGADVPVV